MTFGFQQSLLNFNNDFWISTSLLNFNKVCWISTNLLKYVENALKTPSRIFWIWISYNNASRSRDDSPNSELQADDSPNSEQFDLERPHQWTSNISACLCLLFPSFVLELSFAIDAFVNLMAGELSAVLWTLSCLGAVKRPVLWNMKRARGFSIVSISTKLKKFNKVEIISTLLK